MIGIAKRSAVLLPFLLTACGGTEKPETNRAPVAPGDTMEVRAVPVGEGYDAMGTLRGRETAVVTSRVPGYVREIRVEAGDRVVAGAVLAVLDAPELAAQLRAAESAALEAETGQVEAEAALSAAKAELALASATYDRFLALRDQRAVTRQEFDEVEARHTAAEAQVAMAEARIDRSRSTRTRAEAGVASARAFDDYTRIQAPFAGRVLERRIDLGSMAAPGAPLFVVEQGALRAEVSVEESLAGKIRPGDTARVSAGTKSPPIEGKVAEVVPSVDPISRVFLVKVDLPTSSSESLVAGSFARVTFRIGATSRLLVPRSAVIEKGQLHMVYVVENDESRLRLVTLGSEHGDDVEVLSGLSAGDRIVSR